MPYEGWFSFGGNEVGNEERVRAYVAQMLPTLTLGPNKTCRGDLPTLLGDAPYMLPVIDEAPWFDPDDPDTSRFCGFWPLSVDGLADSPVQATVTEYVSDGGRVDGRRRRTMEVRVTGLLIGQDDAALEAGRTWLKAVLEGAECDPCDTTSLCYLSSVPEVGSVIGPAVTESVALSALSAPTGRWNLATRTFTPTSTSQALSGPRAPSPLPCGEVVYGWTVSGLSGLVVTLRCHNETGITYTEDFRLSGGTDTISISDRGDGEKFSYCTLVAAGAVVVSDVTVTHNTTATAADCFDAYMRQMLQVTCTAPPTRLRRYNPTSGAMESVEFTFTAEVPWVYNTPRVVAQSTPASLLRKVPGASVYPLSATLPVCVPPKRVPLVMDPDVPPVPTPPAPAAPPTLTGPKPDWTQPLAMVVPADAIPLWAEAVPILELHTGNTPARAVRVRFLPRLLDIDDPEDLDPCSVCGGFMIDYIPPNSTFTLDGMRERATITQPGNKKSPAGHLLSGDDAGELFEWPVLTCGVGYYAILDVASTHLVAATLSLAVRE